MQISAEDERIDQRGELAWVVCTERIRGQEGDGAVLATNVFRRERDGRWKLVHHHGSAFVPPPPAPRKRATSPGGKLPN
jgi:ketosteroid isomerase-like protein